MISKVIAEATKEVGYTEGKNNDNKFAAVAGHPNHQPWCATFVQACLITGGEGNSLLNSASVKDIKAWGELRQRIIPLEQAVAGDLILLDFTKSGLPQHIGIAVAAYSKTKKTIATIEGNTGSSNQANGDGVYKKTRAAEFVNCVVRPKYSGEKK